MKKSSFPVRITIPLTVAILLLTAAGCGSNGPAASTGSNVTIPTSSSPATTTPTTTPVQTTTSPPTTTAPATTPPATTPPATTPPVTTTQPPTGYAYAVNIAVKASVGNYLVTNGGLALYYTTSDRPNYSNLPDETLTNWPVFYAATVTVGAGLNAFDFGTYTRDSGKKQTTYKGYPLYTSIYDRTSGDTQGDKLGGVWFVVKP